MISVTERRKKSPRFRRGIELSFWIRAIACLMVLGGVLFMLGCHSAPSDSPQLDIEMSTAPSPPVVGDVDITVKLTDSRGKPVEGADVRLEGNMNHAGMKPTFADLEEVKPGHYRGELEFTMGGDWFVLVTGETVQGEEFQHKIDVPGVKSE